jgi:acetyl-CoA C-acetyltransferase
MPLNKRTAVIGCAIAAPVSGLERSLEEVLYDLVQAALRDAGLSIDDVDGLVVAANDQMDGRAISVMAASGSVGGVDRDILSTPSAGEHAFVMGVLRIASGQYRTQLVVSWSPTEAHSVSEVERLAADPYFHRRLPLDETASFALQASALLGKVPAAAKAADALAGNTSTQDGGKPRWPLTAGMVVPPVTGAVALVLASEDFVAECGSASPAWVRGMGWATETGFLGDRDLSTAPALEAAARHAYAEAGITASEEVFDLAEISDPTPYQQLIALEGLGLSGRDAWADDIATGTFRAGGKLPVNPSGGTRAANAVYCTGLMRIAHAANQVRGRAGAHQVAGARTALAHAASGFAMQYQTVVVLGAHE